MFPTGCNDRSMPKISADAENDWKRLGKSSEGQGSKDNVEIGSRRVWQVVYITGTGKPAGFTRVYGLGKGPGTAIWTPPKTRTRHGLPVTHFGTRHKNVTPPSRLFHTT